MRRVAVLGPVTLEADGSAPAPIRSGRQRAVLAALATRRGRPVAVTELVEELWGSAVPPSATAALQVHVSGLRKVLGDSVRHTPAGYVLEADEVDAEQFETLVAAARGATGSAAVAAYAAAEALWRGEGFDDAGDGPIVAAERARLRELRLAAAEERFAAALQAGRHAEVAEQAPPMVAAHPLRERLTELLMLALYRCGRRDAAAAAFDDLTRALDRELGTPPGPPVAALAEAMRRQDPTLEYSPAGLPAPASRFIGRRAELDALATVVAERRLITLVGPGGAGKTRLAIQLCREAAVPDVFWVDLATSAAPESVLPHVAEAAGVREAFDALDERVVARLHPLRATLVLDNCEHVIEACRLVVALLLARCPGLRVIATSRESLDLDGEVVWPVAGLPVAGDAVRLFLDRARAARPDLAVGADAAAAVERICARLDGLPLAIEMVAARVRTRTPAEVEARLGALLELRRTVAHGPPRHQTMRSVISWSHDQLDKDERRLFRRLAVFAGGFPLDAAIAVGADPDDDDPLDVADVLDRLVDHSMVAVLPGPITRYRMFEVIAEYAGLALADSPDGPAARERHARWFRDLAVRAADFGGDLHGETLREIRDEQANLRAALTWALTERPELALEIAASLWWFWWLTGELTEGRTWLGRALAATPPESTALRATALRGAAALARSAFDLDEARAAGEQALAIALEIGDAAGLARAYNNLCMTANAQGRLADSLSYGRQSRGYAGVAGDARGIAVADNNVGVTLRCLGDVDGAHDLFVAARAGFRALRDRRGEAAAVTNLAMVARLRGAVPDARAQYLASLALYRDLELPEGQIDAIEGLAVVASARGEHEEVLRLLAVADRARAELGEPAFTPDEIRDREAARAAARAALGVHSVPATSSLAELTASLLAAPPDGQSIQ